MKKLLCGFTAACVLLLAACGSGSNSRSGLGDTHKTAFFDFKVVSAEAVDSYDEHVPGEGERLVDVMITTTNTYGSDIEMYDMDYQLQWEGKGTIEEGYSVVLEATNDSMAPAVYGLANGESMTFHYLFLVPEGLDEFYIIYVEEYEYPDGSTGTGDAFASFFTVE